MAAYTNDLRLKEIATGDESGTWGTSTNTNLELIAEAFSLALRLLPQTQTLMQLQQQTVQQTKVEVFI